MNIFVVEDPYSWGMREHIQNMLSDIPGVEVIGHVQYDEPDVIKRGDELSPDIVIFNVSNQNKSIIYFLRGIKERYASIKIMALSNYTDRCYEDCCMRIGVNYFFDKAFFDKSSKSMRVRAFMRIRAALWHFVNTCILNDRFVTLQ